jgi:S1-C subfamily serine protease
MAGGAQGICFAIGIDTAIDVATRLMRDGRVHRARIGVAVQTVSLDKRLAKALKRPGNNAVMISEVLRGGAAEEGGLLPDDIILTLGGQIVAGVDDLHRFLTAERVNVAQNVTLVRGTRVESASIVPKSDG